MDFKLDNDSCGWRGTLSPKWLVKCDVINSEVVSNEELLI